MLKRFLIFLATLVVLCGLYGAYAYTQLYATGLSVSGVLHTWDMRHDERERSYSVYRPTILPDGAPAVFVLHGSMGSGVGMRAMTGREFDHIADREGLVIVYPDGFDKHWNGCRGTADYVA
ncbi:MAG: hypothetical protein HKN19_00490, partial [Halioglobus sp.]|nr:hypothetical protein [Halioglobus sp.]